MTAPVIIMWVLIGIGLFSRRPIAFYLFGITTSFGSMSMIPGGAGTNILPQSLCALVLISKMAMSRSKIHKAVHLAFDLRCLGFLFLFAVFSVFSAVILPRFYDGRIMVVSLAGAAQGIAPLSPSMTNISQLIYLLLSVGVAFVFAVNSESRKFRKIYLQSLLAASLVLICSGLADMIAGSCGLEELLQPFRTASYTFLTDAVVAGQRRVVGLMPEASAYGFACVQLLSLLTFCFKSFSKLQKRVIFPICVIGLIIMAFLSTSSTAIIGLGVLGGVFGAQTLLRMVRESKKVKQIFIGTVIFVSILCFALVAFLSLPSISNFILRVITVDIFQKSTSMSYVVRGMWTHTAAEAFWQTDGVGVGIGSVRTSNWCVNIFASTGILGAFLLGMSFIKPILALRKECQNEDFDLGSGLSLAFIPILAMLAVTGTTPDPGSLNMAALGVISALTGRRAFLQQVIESEEIRRGSVAVSS